ncbi:unnamed protein product [Symbiodinium pilosum]|uniref:Alpha-amylase n=1 Tax=Symbiodinium pilosum TaxID=2952 RepID=A0A812VEZ4_SYMPI|nr:unnamed protein product [Symbiodinium pilosum]
MAQISVRLQAGSRAATASAVPGAACCVVGSSSSLGSWDPKAAPKLQLVQRGGPAWEGIVEDALACAGQDFKFCIWNGQTHDYVWEENGPLHVMPTAGCRLQAVFEDGSADVTAAVVAHNPSTRWQVAGGVDTGGILVRDGRPLTSSELGRLGTGALVEELELVNDRLHYQKLSGDGPAKGWVSLQLKGKELMRKISDGTNQNPAAVPSQTSGPEVSTGKLTLQVKVDHARSPKAAEASRLQGTVCCLVGAPPALGAWDPKQSPKLSKHRLDGATTIWEGSLDGLQVEAGTEYKYCILHMAKNLYIWEESGPMHLWPTSAALHDFEAGQAEVTSLGTWPPPAKIPQVPSAAELGTGIEVWIPWSRCRRSEKVPHSVLHAFHWPFALTLERIRDIGELGFAGVQVSPAQKSKSGGEWWTRYQPQDYLSIDGLGSWDDLRKLSTEADHQGLVVIADVVFNHMLVVASCEEWKRAQSSEKQIAALKRRLDDAVGPVLDAEDFQWPWFEMSGEHWDNENRYEGWGNGEWSELNHSEKVVKVQQQHLQLLLDAGVRCFRFDAVKHMRPAHLAEHMDYLKKSGKLLFAYGEILSVDASMHYEYMQSLAMPSTDFPLAVYMYHVLKDGAKAAQEGVAVSCAKAARSEGLRIRNADGDNNPCLCSDSVRFARNHDTVMNPGSFYGLTGSCHSSRTCWAWLLSLHDGCVLVYPEDLQSEVSGPLICRALRFRSKLAKVAASSEVGLLCADSIGPPGGPPSLLLVALRDAHGALCGLSLVNLQQVAITVTSCSLFRQLGKAAFQDEQGNSVQLCDGRIEPSRGSVSIPPQDAAFLLATT